MAANTTMFLNEFAKAVTFSDLDAIWAIFKSFNEVFTKKSSRFYKLELLVSKLAKASCLVSSKNFALLLKTWDRLDNDNVVGVKFLFISGSSFDAVCSELTKAKKFYHSSKLFELKHAEEFCIKQAICKRIKNFELDKDHIIKSILEHPFCKVVLDYLVVDKKLVLESELVKSKYVFDEAFSGVMCLIGFDELYEVKHCDKSVLNLLLVLLNSCLKEAWILMIPKPYNWEGVLMNIYPIALIKTAYKILSKILSNRISLTCNTFDVLCGNNFSVLKGMSTQSLIFAITYDLVSWEHFEKSLVRIKMVMTDFGLTSDYHSVCEYRLNFYFVSKSGHAESQAGLSSFFVAGVFVNDTIWIGSNQSATQHILNIASDFFQINDILINNDKTVAISINNRYLGIFLLTKGLLKPNLAKTNSDVCFFINLVLRKMVSVSYRMQFSFVLVSVCNKWDALIHKKLKIKSGLSLDFLSDTIHHLSFYDLKFFVQIQSESKSISLISFANSDGILDYLFSHRSHDLQILCWHFVYSLCSLVRICIGTSNNFLVGMVCVLCDCSLSIGGSLANSFYGCGGIPMSVVLVSSGIGSLNILGFSSFMSVCDHLSWVGTGSLSVYTDGFLRGLGTVDCRASATVYFEDIDLGLGIGVLGLMSSTLAEIQVITLASSVHLFSDSQSALDACKSELCWVKHYHMVNIIHGKNLSISWHKVKSHSGVPGNDCADLLTGDMSISGWFFPPHLNEHFLVADDSIISGNYRHFVYNIYHSVCCAYWKVGSGLKFLPYGLLSEINWHWSLLVWHPDLHMAAGYTSKALANMHTYFMKALYCQLSVAV
ncbi:hypothetical protein G9A89_005520 [Geosiphon pyriformis]|nr:hypothetical protein G9A89_005520 [Geosiphon pyriformis]